MALVSENVTEWLIQWNQGDEAALRKLTPIVYSELHRLAAGYLSHERADHTLQATALVHEAYLQIRKLDKVEWKSRAHFIGIAARMMRQILVDHARRHGAQKRGGKEKKMQLTDAQQAFERDLNVVALDQALERFSKDYPRQAQVVELRFFGGLTAEETAEVLQESATGVSSRTVERDWRFARAWLHKELAAPESSARLV